MTGRDSVAGSDEARIVAFEPRHAAAFRDLNIAWLTRFFVVETKDREQLEQAEARIVAAGGAILMAEDTAGDALGCVALIPYADGVLEVAKMAVAERAQGRGIGARLLAAAIETARERGASALYLESNSALGPALRLYERAGFRHLPLAERPVSPYARADVFMRLESLPPAAKP